MFDIETFDTGKLKAIHEQLSHFSKADLINIAKDFSKWEWPTILGKPPIENWETAPDYRRSWMGEAACCRSDYIDPCMMVIRALGITSDDIYGTDS